MITKFEKYNEGINHLLVGPTEEEVIFKLKDNPKKLFEFLLEINKPELIKELNLDSNKILPYDMFRISYKYKYKKGIELSLKNGANISDNDNFLLKKYSQLGKLDDVKFFVENGAGVNKSESIIQTPLVLSSRNGHYEVVKYLLEHGAGTDEWGRDIKQSLVWANSNLKNSEQDFNHTKIKEYKKIIELLKKYQWGDD